MRLVLNCGLYSALYGRSAISERERAVLYVNSYYGFVSLQIIEFLDVKDYPILGYVDPKVITELHVHLWNCAIDYR